MVLQTSPLVSKLSIYGFIASSAIMSILNKLIFEFFGKGDTSKYPIHTFGKPWFQTFLVIIGMALIMICYDVTRKIKKGRVMDEAYNKKYVKDSEEERQHRWIFYVITALTGFSRIVSIVFSFISLMYLEVSTWAFLNCSVVIFVIIIDALIMRKKMGLYHLVSFVLALAGTCLFAASAFLRASNTKRTIVGVVLILLSQIARAGAHVQEMTLFKDIDAKPELIIGLEGFWATVIIFSFGFPITHSLSGPEGNGLHEDLYDTLKMLEHNKPWIAIEVFVVLLAIPLYISSINITTQKSPERLPFCEACSAFAVWVIELILHYSMKNTEFGKKHINIGEEFELNSLLTIFGIILIGAATFIYSRIVNFKCLGMEEKSEEVSEKSGEKLDTFDTN